MSNIAIIEAGQKREAEALWKIAETAIEIGFKDLPAEMQDDCLTRQLYMKAPGDGWEYILEISDGECPGPYSINAWFSVINHAAGMSYNIVSLYNSGYRYIAQDTGQFLYLLKTLVKLPRLDFIDESVEMYLDNWYNDSLIESLP